MVKQPAPPVAFFQLPPEQQAAALQSVMSSLSVPVLTETILKLRFGCGAPAAPGVRTDIRALCASSLDSGLVVTAQEDGGASLGTPGTNISSSTTWSLAEDIKMRIRATLLRATDDDPQFQHLWGKTRVPVLTGKATAIMHSMLQRNGGTLQHFHTCDIVPASTLLTNGTNADGTYNEPSNLRALENTFAPTTLGWFVGNSAYAAHLAQGAMGGRCLKLVAQLKKLGLQHANDAAYRKMGLESAGQAELTTTGAWGVHFLGCGEQVLGVVPSLGSQLAGPASGGGGDCVVATMGVVNCLRALMGQPPIDPAESPLLACTTGEGRGAAQLRRIAEQLRVRGAGEWQHPSQDGGVRHSTELPLPAPPSKHAPPHRLILPWNLRSAETRNKKERKGEGKPNHFRDVGAAASAGARVEHRASNIAPRPPRARSC